MADRPKGIHSEEENETFECSFLEQKLKEEHPELLNLPYKTMERQLYSNGVIRYPKRKNVSDVQGMLELVDDITTSLRDGTKKFVALLKTMQESDDIILQQTAKRLGSYLSQNECRQSILKSLYKARQDGCTIKVRHGKVLFCGAGAAGKTNFLNLLMEKDFEIKHKSTELAKPQQVTIAIKALISSNKNKIEFEKMDIDEEIDLLKSYLPKKYTEPAEDVVPPQVDSQSTMTVKHSFSENSYTTAEHIISSKIASNSTTRQATKVMHSPVWNVLTFMDTGGQPQFISMLPTVNSFAMITFIVHKMTGGKKSLDNKVMVQHGNQQGENSFEPHPRECTYIQLIKTLMTYTSSVMLPDLNFLSKFREVHYENTNSISFVGTHSAKVCESDIEEINTTLIDMIQLAACKNVRQNLNSSYKCLVPVDSKEQTNTDINWNIKRYTDPSIIRKYIYDCQMKQDIYSVPIQWLLLELEIRKVCNDKKCCFITYDEVLKLATEKGLGEEKFIKDGLMFHHLFGVLLYFKNVEGMRKLIITNHQWLFNKLTEIVLYTFDEKTSGDSNELQKGIFNNAMLDKLNIEEDFRNSNINTELINPKKSFLKLLVHLRIIAPLNELQYFMPSLLPSHPLTQLQDMIPGKNSFMMELNETVSAVPFLIQVESRESLNLIPRGFFCFLIVELICTKEWEIYKKNPHDNLITFVKVKGGHYVTLIDNIFFLEIHITHPQGNSQPIHGEILKIIQRALYEVRDKLNISKNLRYGFLCEMCKDAKEKHIAYLRLKYPEEKFQVYMCLSENIADCAAEQEPTSLNASHLIWFYKSQEDKKNDIQNKETAKNVYNNFYPKLIDILPMEDSIFLSLLQKNKLFALDLKDQVLAKATRRDKAMHFLDNGIDRYLKSECDVTPLRKLLEVMSSTDHDNEELKKLAAKIKQKLTPPIY